MKNVLFRSMTAFVSLLGLSTSVSGGVAVTFDDAVNPFSAGTISSDYSVSGSSSLFLDGGVAASYSIPAEYLGKDITVSMQILDQGRWIDRTVAGRPGSAYGSRWAVGYGTNGAEYVGAGIVEKSFLQSSAGYGYHRTASTGDSLTGSWFGPNFYSGTTRAILSSDGGSNDGSGWVAGAPDSEGVWTEWTFEIKATGEVTYYLDGAGDLVDNLASAVTKIYLFGGRTDAGSLGLGGLYVDNVMITTAVPEPETFGLLFGTLVLGVLYIRRRRS